MAQQQRPNSFAPPPQPTAPVPATPTPARGHKGLLFGCLGAAVLMLLLGAVAAGFVVYQVRGATTRARRALATAESGDTSAGRRGTGVSGAATATAPTRRLATARVYGLNQPVVLKTWTVTVVGVERPGKDLVYSAENSTLAATGTWVVIVVTVKKTGPGTIGVAAADCSLYGAGDFVYDVSDDAHIEVDSYYTAFKHGQPLGKNVPPGATVTYYLPFDVAADATALQFVFAPDPTDPAIVAVGNAGP